MNDEAAKELVPWNPGWAPVCESCEAPFPGDDLPIDSAWTCRDCVFDAEISRSLLKDPAALDEVARRREERRARWRGEA